MLDEKEKHIYRQIYANANELTDSINDGIEKAKESIDSGKAAQVLEKMVAMSCGGA